MESPAEPQPSFLFEAAPSLSAPRQQQHSSTEPQEAPTDAEEIDSSFSPEEECSANGQPEEQQPKGDAACLEEIHNHLSSYAAWYSKYENSQGSSEATPPLVKIPYKMMLDVLLQALGLPVAEYRSKQCNGGRMCATVFSHTPGSFLGNDSDRMSVPGIQSINYAMSEDTTAMEAMGYIKRMVKTEIRGYNYNAVKKLKEENKSLKHELAVAKKQKGRMKIKTISMKKNLKMARYKNKNNAMGWFVLTRYMHGLSNHICNVTALNKFAGKETIDQLINGPLINIEKVAERLRRRVIKSKKKFRSIRRFSRMMRWKMHPRLNL